ncbi:Lysophospholipase, alpha-beta hydrolase superfamily [Dyadobacter sp. SG02]|uniref:alpha/beta hydrolase n=1 Tax=Dyadobacter sp. SG02 TaxID=1855291 RepID=UPI0008AB4FA1|nr:alpha/beta hydrolase [Dyadobacter sp. SG02]SEJ78974.1 Lysophospholipase, alpha-beta hydrolase superfamily [Dyadobacter sp. SG02]
MERKQLQKKLIKLCISHRDKMRHKFVFIRNSLIILTILLRFCPNALSQTTVVDSNVIIKLRDGVQISGSLIPPRSGYPLVVLSSPPLTPNRNLPSRRTPAGIFKSLAYDLAERGYGVFWFDNRGMAKSTGTTDSVTLYSQAQDLLDILKFHKSKRPTAKIGLLGISEGGASAEVAAAGSEDVSFLVLLSVQATSGYEFFQYQTKMMFLERGKMFGNAKLIDSLYQRYDRISKPLYKVLEQSEDLDSLKVQFDRELDVQIQNIEPAISQGHKENEKMMFNVWLSPQQLALRKFQPQRYLSKIRQPILALCGDHDDQVQCDSNLNAIRNILENSGHTSFSIEKLPNVDHNYRTLTGALQDLAFDNERFSAVALDKIVAWLEQIK